MSEFEAAKTLAESRYREASRLEADATSYRREAEIIRSEVGLASGPHGQQHFGQGSARPPLDLWCGLGSRPPLDLWCGLGSALLWTYGVGWGRARLAPPVALPQVASQRHNLEAERLRIAQERQSLVDERMALSKAAEVARSAGVPAWAMNLIPRALPSTGRRGRGCECGGLAAPLVPLGWLAAGICR